MKLSGDYKKFFDGAMAGFIIAILIAIIGSVSTIRYIYAMQKDLRTCTSGSPGFFASTSCSAIGGSAS